MRTMLNVFGCGELSDDGMVAETLSCLSASESDGDVERDVEVVHEEVMDEIELCLSRLQRAKSFC